MITSRQNALRERGKLPREEAPEIRSRGLFLFPACIADALRSVHGSGRVQSFRSFRTSFRSNFAVASPSFAYRLPDSIRPVDHSVNVCLLAFFRDFQKLVSVDFSRVPPLDCFLDGANRLDACTATPASHAIDAMDALPNFFAVDVAATAKWTWLLQTVDLDYLHSLHSITSAPQFAFRFALYRAYFSRSAIFLHGWQYFALVAVADTV